MQLLVFTVVAIGVFWISIAHTIENVSAGIKRSNGILREKLLLSVWKTLLKNVVTGSNVVIGI